MHYTPCILFHTFLWSVKQEHKTSLTLILSIQVKKITFHLTHHTNVRIFSQTCLTQNREILGEKRLEQRCKFVYDEQVLPTFHVCSTKDKHVHYSFIF